MLQRSHRDGLLCALLAAAIVTSSRAPAAASRCTEGVSRDAAERLFAILNRPPEEADCKFEGVRSAGELEARWSRGGASLPPLTVVPRECAPAGGHRAGPFVIDIPPQIAASCPSVGPLITAFVAQLAMERPAGDIGSIHDPLFRGARVLFVAIALLAVALLVRGALGLGPAARREPRRPSAMSPRTFDAPWVLIGVASFFGALAVRASLPFSLGNWYTEVLPAVGSPPSMRFGPGYIAFQSLLRDAGIWGPRALVASQLVIGAAAVPLLLAALWELRVGLPAAAATLVLFVFAPFHARLSATASEHVLASTLCLWLLVAWLRAARTGDRLWFGLALLLFPAVCATRIDMAVQAVLVLLWPLFRDRFERAGAVPIPALRWRFVLLGIVAATTLAIAYRAIAIPARHPMPEAAGQLFALRYSAAQFWDLAANEPGWMSLSAVLLAIVGVVSMAVRRPLLLARVITTLLVAFGALGRLFLPDELLAARYFLFTIPVFLILSGYGFEALLTPVPQRYRAATAAAAISLLALWTGLAARQAYAVRYAFQDEYTFARRAMAALPPGCTVYQMPVRSEHFPFDLDCCLDLRRSPLVLDFPHLWFRYVPDDTRSVFDGERCVAYYESIACEATEEGPDQVPARGNSEPAVEYLQQRCAAARSLGRLEPLAETTTSPRSTVNFFHGKPPRAVLYRWRQ